jgi:hypothetical protein
VSVPTDTGAADWRSVVALPSVGVFFQSGLNNLIYLLDRGMGVTCVGYDVRDWFTAAAGFPPVTVLASVQVPNTQSVRFVLSTGYVAEYNYVQKRWSRHQYIGGSTPQYAIVSSGGVYTHSGADGRVYQEHAPTDAAPCFDTLAVGGAQWITIVITTAHVKPGGLQGWATLEYVQGSARALDPCDVHQTASYNYGAATEARTYAYSALSVGSDAAPGIAMWRMSPLAANAQPMAVSITLNDVAPTGGVAVTGRGMRWLSLAYRVSSLGPIYDKLSAGVKQ